MNRWERRIGRAQVLEREYPAAGEFLRFYQEIARFQQGIAEHAGDRPNVFLVNGPLRGPESREQDAKSVPDSLPDRHSPQVEALLMLLERVAPAELAQTAAILVGIEDWDPADPAVAFIYRVIAQPYAECRAGTGGVRPTHSATSICPVCGELPVAAVLRPEGEGGKRSLVCSLCSTEWEFRRLLCPKCGEEDQHHLPVYTAEPFPHVRIEACDTCRTYLKSIDMTKNGLAVPEVDELASLPLDLWAAEHDYTKLKANLFGL